MFLNEEVDMLRSKESFVTEFVFWIDFCLRGFVQSLLILSCVG